MADERIEIELVLDGKTYKTSLEQAVEDSEKKGKEAGSSFGGGFSRGLKSATKAVVGFTAAATAAAAATAVVFTRKAVILAQQQEEAVNRLNIALRSSGDFSAEASQDLQNFASELQSVSRFGDEVILDQLALAKSFGATNEQAKLVAQASADLASELGVSLETATRNVAKTLGGYAGELGETIPELKNFTQEQLRAGAGIDFIAQRFQGGALRSIQTYAGATEQLSNTFGDFLEEIGKVITQSPAVRALIITLSKTFQNLTQSVAGFSSDSGGFIASLINDFFNLGQSILRDVINPLIILRDVGTLVFNAVRTGIQFVIAGTAGIGVAVAQVLNAVGAVSDETLRDVGTFAESSQEVLDDFVAKTKDSFNSIGEDTTFVDTLADKFAEVQRIFNETLPTLTVSGEEEEPTQDTEQKDPIEDVRSFGENFSDVMAGVRKELEETRKSAQDNFQAVGKAAVNIFARGIGTAFSRVGSALANGQNAFKAFASAFVGVFADIASAAGDTFIKLGLANLVTPGGQGIGAAQIAAGAALKVLGGFLSAKAGTTPLQAGGGAGGVSGGGVSGGFEPPSNDLDATVEAARQGSVVNVTVEGSIFDSQDTAQRLADLINDANEEGDVTLNPTVVRA